jgi:hypothetical protein
VKKRVGPCVGVDPVLESFISRQLELPSSASPLAVVMQPGDEHYDYHATDHGHDDHHSPQLHCYGAAHSPSATTSNVRLARRSGNPELEAIRRTVCAALGLEGPGQRTPGKTARSPDQHSSFSTRTECMRTG